MATARKEKSNTNYNYYGNYNNNNNNNNNDYNSGNNNNNNYKNNKKTILDTKYKSVCEIAAQNSTTRMIISRVKEMRDFLPNPNTFHPDAEKPTDLIDYLILLNLNINTSTALTKFEKKELYMPGYHSSFLTDLNQEDGLITLLQQPLDFSHLLISCCLPNYLKWREIWSLIESRKNKLLDLKGRNSLFTKAWATKRRLFLTPTLTLYERLIVWCHAWLTLYIYSGGMGERKERFLVKDLMNDYFLKEKSIPAMVVEDMLIEDVNKIVNEIERVELIVNSIENVAREILAEDYADNFYYSLLDEDLNLIPVVENDLIYLVQKNYETLDRDLKNKRSALVEPRYFSSSPSSPLLFNPSTAKYMWIMNYDRNHFTPDVRKKGRRFGVYGPGLIKDGYDKPDNDEIYENIIKEEIAGKEKKRLSYHSLMLHMYDFFLVEILENQSDSAIIIENLIRAISYTHRDNVEFVTANVNELNLYDTTCRLTRYPIHSTIGVSHVHVPTENDKYQVIYPSPVDFLFCLMTQLALGNGDACVYRDFVTLSTVTPNDKLNYAKVTLIPPVKITKLIDDATTRNNIETALNHVVENYVTVDEEKLINDVYFQDFIEVLKYLCLPHDGMGPLIEQVSNFFCNYYHNGNNDDNDDDDDDDDNNSSSSTDNLYQIVVKNILMATQLVRNATKSIEY